MKKKICLLMLLFCVVFFGQVFGGALIHAEQYEHVAFPEGFENKQNYFIFEETSRKFTTLGGIPEESFENSQFFKEINEHLNGKIESGKIEYWYDAVLSDAKYTKARFEAIMNFSNGVMDSFYCNFAVCVNDVEYSTSIVSIYYNKGRYYYDDARFLNISQFLNCDVAVIEVKKPVIRNNNLTNLSSEITQNVIENIGMGFVYCTNFRWQNSDKDTWMVIDYENPCTLEQALEGMTITDETDGKITEYKIINMDSYDVKTVEPKDYHIGILASDKFGNSTYCQCKVSVKDMFGPKYCSSVTVNSSEKLSEEKITELLNLEDKSGIKSITYDNIKLFTDNRKPGIYTIKGEAVDNQDNKTVINASIEIVDDEKPFVNAKRGYCLYTNEPVDLEAIKANLIVTDNDSARITNIFDCDSYLKTPNKPGKYCFRVTVEDNNPDNKAEYDIYLDVVDADIPYISLDGIAISLTYGKKLSRDEILQIMKGNYPESDIVDVQTDYLSYNNDFGTFDVKLICKDGSTLDSKLIISEKINEIPNTKEFNPLILIISISSGLIIIAGVVAIKTRKRRH